MFESYEKRYTKTNDWLLVPLLGGSMKSRASSCRRIHRWVAVVFCIAIFSFAVGANCQIAGTGSIQGSVADATGAIIQGATVTVTNFATQVKQVATTEGNGLFSFPNLAIGTYTLDVVAQGFQHYTRSNVVLEVGSSIAINVEMTVGRTDQKVEVQSSGLSLQTEDASFKQTIDQQTVTEMPLNGRQMTNLITLSGGSTAAPAGDFTGSKFSYQTISVSIAGGGGNTTMWRLDGGDNNDYMANGNLPFPFPDAVSQFSVESTALSSQNSMHAGGLVNVVTRSGTNSYHGSAFEFIRNNYINARHPASEPVWRHLRRADSPGQALCLRGIPADAIETVSGSDASVCAYCREPCRGFLRDRWTQLYLEWQDDPAG